ncbi:MAG: dipeptide epimerase [Clostridiales bacterium]|jgi:L-alanine-DL-glutamate epimerase-like enolase superfamily enzyme|nr:dipeptide epimerase [Clostridiales bacterium]
MKIAGIEAKKVVLPLAKEFRISLGAVANFEAVFVKVITDEGLFGYGEASPFAYVTGETCETVIDAISYISKALTGLDPFSIEAIHRTMDRVTARNGSAKAAIDIALYDIMSKAAGVPLYKFLGGSQSNVETDMTISIDDPQIMGQEAKDLSNSGFRMLKIKAGGNREADLEAIDLIRKNAPNAHLKIDANQGWKPAQALEMARAYEKYGVQSIEQPVPAWDLDGLAYVRRHSPIPIMADESCFTPQDAFKIAKLEAADIINIKLMKCGGIYRALQICSVAESAGIPCMVGCMMESRIAIAAGAALVASHPNIILADLDSFVELENKNLATGGFEFDTPVIKLGDASGLGVETGLFE